MKLSTQLFLKLAVFIIMMGCRQTKTIETSKPDDVLVTSSEKLVPIDFSDTNYEDLRNFAKDTTTADGWSITYLVKDDSTRYEDLYIMCSKGNITAVHREDQVLEYRRYFIPEFEAETETNIYFTHGCATDCSAILVFDKDKTASFTDYQEVVNYNIPFGQILYVTDNNYEDEVDIYELDLADIIKHKIHKLSFNGNCNKINKPACVEKVMFSKNEVSVTVRLRKSIESVDQVKQTKTVRL